MYFFSLNYRFEKVGCFALTELAYGKLKSFKHSPLRLKKIFFFVLYR